MNFLKVISGLILLLGLSELVIAQCPPAGGGTFSGNLTISTACTVSGDLELTSKNITISSGGSLSITGSFLNSGNGSVTIDGGTLAVTGSFENAGNGTVEVNNDGVLDVTVDYTNGGNGTSDFVSGTITIGGNYLNEGNGNIEAGGVVQVGGDFTVDGNGTTTVDGGLTIGGTADLGSKGVDILDGGVLSANAIVSGGNIDVDLGGTIYVESGSITGTVNNDPGNLDQDCTNNCCGSNCNTVGDDLNDTGTAILPIELISFNAEQTENGTLLKWSSASETNNDFYTIEKSYDGNSYSVIAKISGAGNSSERIDYDFTDISQLPGLVYFRLSQTDYDGTSETFDVVFVNIKGASTVVEIYPTSVESGSPIYIKSNEPIQILDLAIIDLRGNLISTKVMISGGGLEIGTSGLIQGTYVLHGLVNDKMVQRRIIVN